MLGFVPHLWCLSGNPWLVWSSVASDVIIWLSYCIISLGLFWLGRRLKVRFVTPIVLFGGFIFLCGFTHFWGAVTMFRPAYYASVVTDAATALFSGATAIWFLSKLPLVLRSNIDLQKLGRDVLSTETDFDRLQADRGDTRAATPLQTELQIKNLHVRLEAISKRINSLYLLAGPVNKD